MTGVPRADFFVLRAPLLALETLSRWAEGAQALTACADDDDMRLEEAVVRDRTVLRGRLAELAADDQIADALALGSPDLADGVARWRTEPSTKRGRSAERSLVRYLTRMASRPDLFGLAGGYLIGQFSEGSRLELLPRSELEVRARVDSGLLRDVVRRAAAESAESPDIVVRRNPGVYRAGGRLRVAARKQGTTGHRLVQIRSTPTIELALATAAQAVSIGSLVATLEAAGSPPDHAPELVRRLMRSELLVPAPEISVTGAEPTRQAVEALATAARRGALCPRRPARRRGRLRSAEDLPAADRRDVGGTRADRRGAQPQALPPGRCAPARRGAAARGLAGRDAPHHRAPQADHAADQGPLHMFKEAFERRFATRSVPLLEALDPDFGIRLGGALGEDAPPESAVGGAASTAAAR